MSETLSELETRFARFDSSFDFAKRYADTDPVIQKLFDEATRSYDPSKHPIKQPLERFLDEILLLNEQMANPQYAMAVAIGYNFAGVQTIDDLLVIYWTFVETPDSRYIGDN